MAICDLFLNWNNLWKDKPLIAKGVERLNALLVRIKHEAMMQEKNKTKGYTAEKDKQRDHLEEMLIRLAGKLRVYAHDAKDAVVVSQMKMPITSLSRLSLNVLLARANAIVQTATQLMPIPDEYEIKQEDIDELMEMMKYTGNLNAHRDAIQGERSGNTALLKNLFVELREEMEKMDLQVKAYITNPEFTNVYFFTRRIRDTRGGSTKKKEGTTA
jgi:hypothetical protein